MSQTMIAVRFGSHDAGRTTVWNRPLPGFVSTRERSFSDRVLGASWPAAPNGMASRASAASVFADLFMTGFLERRQRRIFLVKRRLRGTIVADSTSCEGRAMRRATLRTTLEHL